MIGPYLVKNPLLYAYLRCLDAFFVVSTFFRRRNRESSVINKILLVQWAHLGDLIITTGVLPELKKAYPEAKIGILVGSWGEEIIRNHPLIDYIHIFDHPKITRSSVNFIVKLFCATKQYFNILKELRGVQYDLSIDVYCYYPNSHLICWSSRIPNRIGYVSGGGGPLLTRKLSWYPQDKHMSLYYLDLLTLVGVPHKNKSFLKSCLPPVSEQITKRLKVDMAVSGKYVVFHPHSGDKTKNWPAHSWSHLIEAFSQLDYFIVFSGKSSEERAAVDKIILGKKKCINLVGKLSINEFRSLLHGAKALICVDTMAAHLAAEQELPILLCIWKKEDKAYWVPATDTYKKAIYQKDLDYDNLVRAFFAEATQSEDGLSSTVNR